MLVYRCDYIFYSEDKNLLQNWVANNYPSSQYLEKDALPKLDVGEKKRYHKLYKYNDSEFILKILVFRKK